MNNKIVNILENEINKIREDIVIVEGKKDKDALISLKIPKQNIFIINEDGKSLYEKIEEVEKIIKKDKKRCVILTDFDKKGKQLYLIIKKELLNRGVKLNNRIRKILLRLHISHIEGLNTFITNQKV